jgi:hypothetical protein
VLVDHCSQRVGSQGVGRLIARDRRTSAVVQDVIRGLQTPSTNVRNPFAREQRRCLGEQSRSLREPTQPGGVQADIAGVQADIAGVQADIAGVQTCFTALQTRSQSNQSRSDVLRTSLFDRKRPWLRHRTGFLRLTSRLQAGEPRLKAGKPRLQAGEPRLKAGEPRLKAGEPRLKASEVGSSTGRSRTSRSQNPLTATGTELSASDVVQQRWPSRPHDEHPRQRLRRPNTIPPRANPVPIVTSTGRT